MVEQGCFVEGGACLAGEQTVPEPEDDEVVIFKEFFFAGLRMPPHPVIMDILLKLQVQLHQVTPNDFAQLSKYFWDVTDFKGTPSSDGFVKRYELHYQSKKMEIDGGVMEVQFGCLNFHAKPYKGSGCQGLVPRVPWAICYDPLF
jgi:hypothetical protein